MPEHVCPWWVGYLLASPVRKWMQNPEKILQSYVKPGMTVLDVGCAMGFFTLPLAKLVGANGHVVAVDLQEKMLRSLKRRVQRAKLSERVEMRQCPATSLGLDDYEGKVDFALTFAVLHEMPDINAVFTQIARTLRDGGKLLAAEPTGHVSASDFEKTIEIAGLCGLTVIDSPRIKRSHAAVLKTARAH